LATNIIRQLFNDGLTPLALVPVEVPIC